MAVYAQVISKRRGWHKDHASYLVRKKQKTKRLAKSDPVTTNITLPLDVTFQAISPLHIGKRSKLRNQSIDAINNRPVCLGTFHSSRLPASRESPKTMLCSLTDKTQTMVGFLLTDIVGNCDSHQLCINSVPTKSLLNGSRCIVSVSRILPKTTLAKFAGPLLGLSSEGVEMNHVPPTRALSAHTVLTNLEVTKTFSLRAQHMSINALASVMADRCLFGECSCLVMGCVMIDLRWKLTRYRGDEKLASRRPCIILGNVRVPIWSCRSYPKGWKNAK